MPSSHVTHEEARGILVRFNASHWRDKLSADVEKARYSIPANPDRDDDIRLGDYIKQNEDLAAQLAEAVGLLRRTEGFLSETGLDGLGRDVSAFLART